MEKSTLREQVTGRNETAKRDFENPTNKFAVKVFEKAKRSAICLVSTCEYLGIFSQVAETCVEVIVYRRHSKQL